MKAIVVEEWVQIPEGGMSYTIVTPYSYCDREDSSRDRERT